MNMNLYRLLLKMGQQNLKDNKLLRDLRKFSKVYIDDIIIFSDSWEAHLEHIALVLGKLLEAGLTANCDKCRCPRPLLKS